MCVDRNLNTQLKVYKHNIKYIIWNIDAILIS